MTIQRFSSRTSRLDTDFLANNLKGATKYLRIAGYFRSSIFELISEEISQIPEVKIVCNSELDINDFRVAANRDRAIKENWNENDLAAESLLQKRRYQLLDDLLRSGNVEIRVVPRDELFLHGKAGSIHYADGSRKSFIGSVNESRRAFAFNYELVWEDDTEESADWVEGEFNALWQKGVPLPNVIIEEIHRIAHRQETTVEALAPKDVPAAAMVESPIYRGGEQLQPWQRSFVAMFIEHRERYGKARLLLADEVGVGKTLSMATSALVSVLLGDGPVLILAPSTLTIQWQVELIDKLGIPSAVWSSISKSWLGVDGQHLSSRGDYTAIRQCPHKIAIVSTGLIMHQYANNAFERESAQLLANRYGMVILDEAHKARRRGGVMGHSNQPNNLLNFMHQIAKQTRHLILGTATPIQTDVRELWDLMSILNTNAQFVLGDTLSPWQDHETAKDIISGKETVNDVMEAWAWLRNPLPPYQSGSIEVDNIRDELGVRNDEFESSYYFDELPPNIKDIWLFHCLDRDFFVKDNPIIRHTVLRKRKQLEDLGLLQRVGVHTHPIKEQSHQYQSHFIELGLPTNAPFEAAYQAAETFSKLLQARTRSGGFMKSLMLQRLCSSFASGLATAERMLKHTVSTEGDEDTLEDVQHILANMSPAEEKCLRIIKEQLSRENAVDTKLRTIKWFLKDFTTDGKTWLQHGCIIFSQYYDTVNWVAKELSSWLEKSGEVVAVYAGLGKSGLYKGSEFVSAERETIKTAIKNREIRLVVATDAACEGLNLQTLGTLINCDLPWNPSRLEQRLGRIKRFGQTREFVDMLNLVYKDTQDEKIYEVLSERLKDVYDIFGSIPDTIEDDWIENEEGLQVIMDTYMHKRKDAQNAFSLKYDQSVSPHDNAWEQCATVLSRRDIIAQMSEPW